VTGAAALLPKFFVICSSILILAGVAQLFVRPRRANESLAEKLVNRATITALLSVVFGILGLLIGIGALPMPHFK
jgi:hypothetical protein